MTLQTQIPRVIITGNGTLGPYSLVDENSQAIRFVSTSHVRLTRYASTEDDDGTALVLNVDYTVGGTQDARTFTLIGSQAVLTTSQRIVAERSQAYTQDLSLTTGGAFNAAAVMARLDKHAEYLQELRTGVDRAIKTDWADDEERSLPLPPTTGPMYLTRETDGSIGQSDAPALAAVSAGYLVGDELSAPGDGVETVFVLSGIGAASPRHLDIQIDITGNQPWDTYTVSYDSGTGQSTVTFDSAPPDGSTIYFRPRVYPGMEGPQGPALTLSAQYRIPARVSPGGGASEEITSSANVFTFLGAANYAAMRTQLGLVIGTDVQAYDADLAAWAGVNPSSYSTTAQLQGAWTHSVAGLPLRATNTTDSANVQGLIIEGDRATPAGGDIVYASFYLSDSAGNQEEFVRLAAVGSTVTNSSEAAYLLLYGRTGGSLTAMTRITTSAITPNTSGGQTIGSTTLPFSGLFLGASAPINFGNGDVLITPSTNALAFTGASSGYSFDASVTLPSPVINTGVSGTALAAASDVRAQSSASLLLTPASLSQKAAFFANKNASNQTGIASDTFTKITYGTESYDIGSAYDTTNSRWTPPAGRVRISAQCLFSGSLTSAAANGFGIISIYKNGSEIARCANAYNQHASDQTSFVTTDDNANGTDYYEAYCYVSVTAGTVTADGSLISSRFWGSQI